MSIHKDFVTGKAIKINKPEERVRQDYEKQLVLGYGYPKEHLNIEVSIPRGGDFFSERADLVIYRSAEGREPTSDIEGIVEFKRPEQKDGIAQLKSYMTATSAKWGVWTNGTDIRYVCRDPSDHLRLLDDYLHNVPAYGQKISDIGNLTKSQLVPFERAELKIIFGRILNKLYANSQLARRDQLGAEMVKLIFAKIEDETTFPDRPPEFRVQVGEPPETVSQRIEALFQRVLSSFKGEDIFAENESIHLDPSSTAEVVGQLERGSLTLTDTDVVGDAFEVFAESRLAGERGQFFTPRGVVSLAVLLTDPKPGETVCDPACGSGGFLIRAMRHIWTQMDQDPQGQWGAGAHLVARKKQIAAKSIYGIDKEVDLVKIAKAYMAIAGDGRSNIRRNDSLATEASNSEKFDVVLTNPPFGTKSKVQVSLSRNFELGYAWQPTSNVWQQCQNARACDPYILFIEHCFNIANETGRIAMILPETVFHAPSLGYVRQYILQHGNVNAIVDLPHNSFRPHCNAKTCLIVISKNSDSIKSRRVLMATPKEMGHDLQGKPLLRPDSDEIWDDLMVVEQELVDPTRMSNKHTFVVDASVLAENDCWVPRFHRGLKFPQQMPPGCRGVTIGELVADQTITAFAGHGSPRAAKKGLGPIPYIRVADIVNWEAYHNPVSGIPVSERLRLKAEQRSPQVDDILFVRRGSYRIGTVAIVGPRDTEAVLTSELLTLRVNPNNSHQITPPYLLAMLSTQTVQEQIPPKVCVDTTLPNLGDRWKTILVPIHNDKNKLAEISSTAEAIVANRSQAWHHTAKLTQQLGEQITQ